MTDRLFALAIVLFLCGLCCAQSPQTVEVFNGRFGGTGVICGTSDCGTMRVLLTVHHVVGPSLGSDGRQRQVMARIRGKRYGATVVGSDKFSDAAMLLIWNKGPVQQIEDARLYMGQIHDRHRVRTEGFAYFGYHESHGRVQKTLNRGTMVQWSSGSHSGMSGGPSWLVDHPGYFVSTTTATDGDTSMGPHREWFEKWIPTCSNANYQFGVSSQGSVTLRQKPLIARSAGRPVIDPSCQVPSQPPPSGPVSPPT